MFHKGDKVIIFKPKDVREWPSWVSSMDKFDHRVAAVKDCFKYKEFECVGISRYGYEFNVKWCRLATPDEIKADAFISNIKGKL